MCNMSKVKQTSSENSSENWQGLQVNINFNLKQINPEGDFNDINFKPEIVIDNGKMPVFILTTFDRNRLVKGILQNTITYWKEKGHVVILCYGNKHELPSFNVNVENFWADTCFLQYTIQERSEIELESYNIGLARNSILTFALRHLGNSHFIMTDEKINGFKTQYGNQPDMLLDAVLKATSSGGRGGGGKGGGGKGGSGSGAVEEELAWARGAAVPGQGREQRRLARAAGAGAEGGGGRGGGGRGGGGRGGGGSKILSEDEQIQQAIYESLKAEEEKMRKIIESFKNF